MTEHFEVVGHDGAARLGELRLADPVVTPALVDDVLVDAGSRWREEPPTPAGDDGHLTVLPHRGLPAGTDPEVEAAFAEPAPEVDFPAAAVGAPATAERLGAGGADAFLLSTAQGLVGHAEAFVDAVVRTKEALPADVALGLSGVATPRNAATLVYAGVDLLDAERAAVAGTRGRYLTREDDRPLDALEELTCPCPACDAGLDAFDREACAEHNRRALAAELATVRERIRQGRLRDYVEAQARHDQWLTGVLRRLDDRWGYLEPRTPVHRRATIAATTDDAMRRVEIRRFADRVTARYVGRFGGPLVLVPCSARKPYGDSKSHARFHETIHYRGHKVSMTSPIGVVPQELELTYPAQHYDTTVTGRWSETEIDFVARVLGRYLDRVEYDRVVAHVPEEGYRAAVERALEGRDLPVEFTVADHPTDDDSLAALAAALEGEGQYTKRERERRTVRAIADFQFGDGAGEALFDDVRIQAPWPKHRVHDPDGEQLAALEPSYGLLALTLEGARRWADSTVPVRRVTIDSFVPHGSVLAPGVVDASDGIRVGDEVVVEGPQAFGVGRAEMHGAEMASSSRGVAVDVRHVEER
ncbi:MAG: archaeosine synthase subunit alpha [Halobacteriales archaeon]|nr:archaeosine synthase subunit alpha [Halobacteriales archaeon]